MHPPYNCISFDLQWNETHVKHSGIPLLSYIRRQEFFPPSQGLQEVTSGYGPEACDLGQGGWARQM